MPTRCSSRSSFRAPRAPSQASASARSSRSRDLEVDRIAHRRRRTRWPSASTSAASSVAAPRRAACARLQPVAAERLRRLRAPQPRARHGAVDHPTAAQLERVLERHRRDRGAVLAAHRRPRGAMTSGVTSARAASCTATTSHSAGSAASPRATECCRCSPPSVHATILRDVASRGREQLAQRARCAHDDDRLDRGRAPAAPRGSR